MNIIRERIRNIIPVRETSSIFGCKTFLYIDEQKAYCLSAKKFKNWQVFGFVIFGIKAEHEKNYVTHKIRM